MKKIHEKSIILGIGIGMIITSIAGLVFSRATGSGTEADNLSKEEIIRLAKNYGMVEPIHLIEDDLAASTQTPGKSEDNTTSTSKASDTGNPTQQPSEESSAQDTAQATQTPQESTNQDNPEERNIVIEIKKGYNSNQVAQLLYEKGVISNKKEFVDVMAQNNATTKINVGSYTFKKNEDYYYIVKTICNI